MTYSLVWEGWCSRASEGHSGSSAPAASHSAPATLGVPALPVTGFCLLQLLILPQVPLLQLLLGLVLPLHLLLARVGV